MTRRYPAATLALLRDHTFVHQVSGQPPVALRAHSIVSGFEYYARLGEACDGVPGAAAASTAAGDAGRRPAPNGQIAFVNHLPEYCGCGMERLTLTAFIDPDHQHPNWAHIPKEWLTGSGRRLSTADGLPTAADTPRQA
jgi:hypothetical protein